MRFNDHSRLDGKHAFLSPSKYHWVNYTPEKLDRVFRLSLAAQRGVALHDLAQRAIVLGVKLPRTAMTLNAYVNDAIGFRMVPEQILYYSRNAFGTADAISFRKNKLRIHDLKTGITRVSFKQLCVYCALFCLEYNENPLKIDIELRIYFNDDVTVYIPEGEEISLIMDRIVTFDKQIERLREEEEL